MFLALLVLLAGLVGFVVVKSVSRSGDSVAREPVPLQNSVMNAALAVSRVNCATSDYLNASSGLEGLAEN